MSDTVGKDLGSELTGGTGGTGGAGGENNAQLTVHLTVKDLSVSGPEVRC